jgi:hypothetical protein
MHLKLNLNGSVDPFVNYLKNFVKIRPSLLIEIDTNTKAFVAKTFSEDRASVRFSAISFSDCNMSVVSNDGEEELKDKRIKAGILIQLPKFIRIVERFGADVDEKGLCNFDIDIDYDKLAGKDNSIDYVTTAIGFNSPALKMKMDGFRISELKYLSDDTFNNVVFNVQDPATLEISPATISSIIKTSDIIKIDARKDTLVFYVDGQDVYVKDFAGKDDKGKDKPANFVFKIGTLEQKPGYEIRAAIFREKFIQMMDKTDDTYKLILGRRPTSDGGYVVDRILFDSINTSTKVVISIVNEG